MAVVVLAPLARSGYVLRYDMVFVPRQPLRWDLVAPAGALPRAVPLDALVSLASTAVPGWLLQRIVLAAVLVGAAVGAGRLVPARHTGTRLVAAVAYAWTPFLAERLLIGQWGLLLCYAAMPWLVLAVRAGAGARLVLAAAVASVTPTGGVIAFATTLVLAPRRPRALAAVAALNAPWLIAAALTAAPGRSDPGGVAAFAARAENWGGTLVALAGTGGIWNARTVPVSRTGPAVPLIVLGLVVAAVAGFRVLRRRWSGGGAGTLALLAGGSLLLAAAGTVPWGAAALRFAVVHVPGGGLLRDGQKFLIPYALWLAVCVALAAERLAERAGETGPLVLAGFVLLPVVALPDLAWGVGGKLRPVAYPAEWDAVASRVARAPGPVVSLPMSAYRAYSWNEGTPVFDPATRYLPAPVVTDDRLRVGAAVVAGEDPGAARVLARLGAGLPAADESVRWVLVQRDTGGAVPAPTLSGLMPVYSGQSLDLYANPAFRPAAPEPRRRLWALLGYLLAAAALAASRFTTPTSASQGGKHP